jgi:putative ABC transport system permease protein
MKLLKCLKHALKMVINSRLRSWLTIIGIVIGVASVVAIVGVGNGMEQSINDQLGDLGVDMITVVPGASKGSSFGPPGRVSSSDSTSNTEPLGKRELQAINAMSEVDEVMAKISDKAEVYYMGSEGSLTVTGVDQRVWKQFITENLAEGRYLGASDSNVIVIGYDLAHEYFDDLIGLNKILTIEGKAFRVVGILEEGTRNDIYMPINSAYDILENKDKEEYDSLSITLRDGFDLANMTDKIETKLMLIRHVNEKEKDFTVRNTLQTSNMRSEMVSTMTTFLTAIAAISLIVGAVGIANTMFTSVLEKTKQIGIMKAIGAKNKDILIIFIMNAAIIGLVGGIMGIFLGYLLSIIMTSAGMISIITMDTVLGSLGVAVLAGIIAGYIPAYQASMLKPVDALRYE